MVPPPPARNLAFIRVARSSLQPCRWSQAEPHKEPREWSIGHVARFSIIRWREDGSDCRRFPCRSDIARGVLGKIAIARRLHHSDLRGAFPRRFARRNAVPDRQCYRHVEDDGRHGHYPFRRRRPRLRRHDGAAPPGRHRHGPGRAALRPQRAVTAHGARDHRNAAAGDRGDAARGRRAPAAAGGRAGQISGRANQRFEIRPSHAPCEGAVVRRTRGVDRCRRRRPIPIFQ
jgi:hypothetical protein